ncbi:MAG: hypothetical protein KGI70_02895 [Patescibacteria group bacterium]|nr:hypothetical protein [Patescibacteria group bacterium]
MKSPVFVVASLFFVALGWWLPLWPLSALGIVLLAAGGAFPAAFVAGVVLDLLWGAPPSAAWFAFPFVALAVLVALVRLAVQVFLLDKRLPERV